MGGLASFGDDDFITHEQVDLLRPIHMMPEEHPWLFRYAISASIHADFRMIPGFAPKVRSEI
jgi:hypothetical protein